MTMERGKMVGARWAPKWHPALFQSLAIPWSVHIRWVIIYLSIIYISIYIYLVDVVDCTLPKTSWTQRKELIQALQHLKRPRVP